MIEKSESYEQTAQNTIDVARAFEYGIMTSFIAEYKVALESENAMERAQALARLRRSIAQQSGAFQKEVSKAAKKDMKAIGDLAYSKIDKRSKKSVKPAGIVKVWNKKNNKYWKKYIRTKGTNLVVDGKGIPQLFTFLLDQDVKRVVDGETTVEKAISDAIHKLSSNGVSVIEYDTGIKRNVEVFVRQQMVYASKESTNELREKNAKKDGITIWEWDAHADARPTHKEWQGKRFDTTGKEYPKSVSHGQENDYGCLHRKFPVYDKDDPYAYTKKELENIDTKPFKWRGKTFKGYEAKQQMRAMERKIRNYKREMSLLDDAGLGKSDEAKGVRYLLRQANADYSSFCDAYGTYRRSNRLKI